MTASALIHPQIVDRFSRLLTAGRLGHAYLFSGPPGIGKFETACFVAGLVNCREPSRSGIGECACPSCRRIAAGTHPDVFIVQPREDKTEIIIEQVREELLPRLNLKPYEARLKVVIFREAGTITSAAASALLKTLEEPPADTLFILTTSALQAVIPTIASRCQPVVFFPPSYSQLAQWLKNEYDVELSDAVLMARLSGGSPGKAKTLTPEFVRVKNSLIDRFVFGRIDDKELKAMVEDKEEARCLLEVLVTFFRDVLAARSGVTAEGFIHTDRSVDIGRLAAKYTDADLSRIMAQIVFAMKGLRENFNVKVALALLKEMM